MSSVPALTLSPALLTEYSAVPQPGGPKLPETDPPQKQTPGHPSGHFQAMVSWEPVIQNDLKLHPGIDGKWFGGGAAFDLHIGSTGSFSFGLDMAYGFKEKRFLQGVNLGLAYRPFEKAPDLGIGARLRAQVDTDAYVENKAFRDGVFFVAAGLEAQLAVSDHVFLKAALLYCFNPANPDQHHFLIPLTLGLQSGHMESDEAVLWE